MLQTPEVTNNNDMSIIKILLFVLLTILGFVPVRSQTQNTANTENASQGASETWNTVKIRRWGVRSLSLPPDFHSSRETTTDHKDEDITWTKYYHSWKTPFAAYGTNGLEIKLEVITWDVDFSRAEKRKDDSITPEYLLGIDYSVEASHKGEIPGWIIETKFQEISGEKGLSIRYDKPENKNFSIEWHAYRYFGNRAQKIIVFAQGELGEAERAAKIIATLNLE